MCTDFKCYYCGCSKCNNDGTCSSSCYSRYYKSNDNKCYKCMIDGYSECNSDGTCNYCNSEYYKSNNNKCYKCIECYDCNKEHVVIL